MRVKSVVGIKVRQGSSGREDWSTDVKYVMVPEESKLLIDPDESLKFFRDMNTNVKIIFSMFSPGRFSSLNIPFYNLPGLIP